MVGACDVAGAAMGAGIRGAEHIQKFTYNPIGQWQKYCDELRFVQRPPFLHGFRAHGLVSWLQLGPEYPGRQVQLGEVESLVH